MVILFPTYESHKYFAFSSVETYGQMFFLENSREPMVYFYPNILIITNKIQIVQNLQINIICFILFVK